ncbi:cytochrome c biogenesis protein [Actinopolyspora lacussalsi subsp. righensis]|uniref:Cytochrome c biogenesis protein n=1 Tax=Actinopolyspora righensis TaxID=995060 RepID=A0A1I6ZC75_9ACTN|nr:cytochrome c biogenesis protein ResB [Actinopolyspora righensis]SFT60303.1 cytochrome c biogenesis protein [Actinopolyspora righensis]
MNTSVPRRVLAFLRNTWRGLTSMRTALVLLFLLALAALPGALLPQWSLNRRNVETFYDNHPTWAKVLDSIGAFNVFSSVWFAAIYVLLFVSLIGCLVPRSAEYLRQLRARPVRTPRNLERMPHHAAGTVSLSPDEMSDFTRRRLRRWRVAESTAEDGTRTFSAERGYLREAGNLVFHFALVGLLITVGGDQLMRYEGQKIVKVGDEGFCNSGTFNYDSFDAGLTVDGTNLSPFCVRLNDFDVRYLHSGQPERFHADIEYQAGEALDNGDWKSHDLRVNNPLRTAGDRVYLTGNGYTPIFTVTFPDGTQRTKKTQWQPVDTTTMLSQGATKFDRPGMSNEQRRHNNQLAITGLFAPTASLDGKVLSSRFPALRDPMVAVDVLKGKLGLAGGRGQSIFSVDQSLIDSGELNRVARENLAVGDTVRLDDGTTIRFDGVERWANLQISHNPFQRYVLVFAVAIVIGLGASLSIKRRRIWLRIKPLAAGSNDTDENASAAGGTTGGASVEIGGLARTDQAGYGEEFTKLADELLGSGAETTAGSSRTDSPGRSS